MDQFDKKIGKTLAKGPRHEPDSEVWDKIAPHLSPPGTATAVSWFRPAVITAALLALASVFYWLGTRHASSADLESELEKLAQTIEELQQKRDIKSERMVDTVVIRDTVWHLYYPDGQVSHDLKNVPLAKQNFNRDNSPDYIKDYSPEILKTSSLEIVQMSRQILENNYWNLINGRTSTLSKEKYSAEEGPEVIVDRTGHANIHYRLLDTKTPLLSNNFKRNIRLHPYQGLLADQIIRSEKSKRLWNSILPDRVRIGAIVGGLNPILHEVEHTQEWVAGVQTELLFSPRISLLTGFRYRYLHYKNEGEFENNFPIPAGIQAGDRIREVYTTTHFQNIPLLFKYSYPLSERLFPYLQTGLLLGGASNQYFKYEILRNGEELELTAKSNDSQWIINSYLVGLGMEYNPSNHITLTLDLEGRYHFRIPEVEYNRNSGLGMRLGLYYSF